MRNRYKTVKKIQRKGFPTSARDYFEAHAEASEAEKRKFPRGYKKLKKMDAKTPAKQLLGTHLKSGKILVSSRVPKSLRKEVAFHEKYESLAMRRLANSKRKK